MAAGTRVFAKRKNAGSWFASRHLRTPNGTQITEFVSRSLLKCGSHFEHSFHRTPSRDIQNQICATPPTRTRRKRSSILPLQAASSTSHRSPFPARNSLSTQQCSPPVCPSFSSIFRSSSQPLPDAPPPSPRQRHPRLLHPRPALPVATLLCFEAHGCPARLPLPLIMFSTRP